MSFRLNVMVAGLSVSGDLDTESPVTIHMGNSDRIGSATFTLQNKYNNFTKTIAVGTATLQIDAIPRPGVTQTIFRGTVEKTVNSIDIKKGTITEFTGYDYGQELLGIVSPDARLPYGLSGGGMDVGQGDGGIAARDGMELTQFVSGVNPSSGVTVSDFMCQYFGVSGNITGSFSGQLYSLKPYHSGLDGSGTGVWKTYYVPDASGFVRTNDNNLNFFIPFDSFKVKREYGWDILRKLTRQNMPILSGGELVNLEVSIGISGDIHIFTSGSYEFVASGVVLQYYPIGSSGSTLNNIIDAKIPFDSTSVKNYILGWFPPWTAYPLDHDGWSDFFAYSGGWFSTVSGVLSGNAPATNIGSVSIQGGWAGGVVPAVGATLFLSLPGSGTAGAQFVNLLKWNLSGNLAPVAINYMYRFGTNGNGMGYTSHGIALKDLSGATISKFGSGQMNFPAQFNNASGPWMPMQDIIYTQSGTFFSGTGSDGGWSVNGAFDAGHVNQIQFRLGPAAGMTSGLMGIDNVFFSFNYPFSPVAANNAQSIGGVCGYGTRYAVVEFPYEVTDTMASGVITHELQSRMGQKAVATFDIVDNPLNVVKPQLNIKPGQMFTVDAPSLNTGSGLYFTYWKAIEVNHTWSASQGFKTKITAIPHYSGTLTLPQSNQIDYQLPLQFHEATPPMKRNEWMPVTYPWVKV